MQREKRKLGAEKVHLQKSSIVLVSTTAVDLGSIPSWGKPHFFHQFQGVFPILIGWKTILPFSHLVLERLPKDKYMFRYEFGYGARVV